MTVSTHLNFHGHERQEKNKQQSQTGRDYDRTSKCKVLYWFLEGKKKKIKRKKLMNFNNEF